MTCVVSVFSILYIVRQQNTVELCVYVFVAVCVCVCIQFPNVNCIQILLSDSEEARVV